MTKNYACCAFCNLAVTEYDGVIGGSAPEDGDNPTNGYHYACEDRAEADQEIRDFAERIVVESNYRGPGMW